MSSKRSFQQRDEEPWLRYPDSTGAKDFSRSSATSQRHQFSDFGRQEFDMMPPQQPRSETNSNHKRTISKVNGPSSPSAYQQHHRHNHQHMPEEDNSVQRLALTHQNRSSYISRRGPAPRTLSEELSKAMQSGPEDSYPSPITPSGLLPSPADLSAPSTSSSPSSNSSSDNFPLFKPSLTSQQNSHGSGENGVGRESPSFPFQLGNSTSAISHDSTTVMDQPENSDFQHGPKPGRATKGIHRFGFPHFRPQIDDSYMETNTKTASTSTSRSGGYGIQRGRDEDDEDEDDEDMDGMGSYSSEPPKKRLRSTASMLIGAAVETVIFTGAVALSAYQLLTGKGKQNDSHSKHSSLGSEDDDIVEDNDFKTQDEDPMEEKLTFRLDTPTSESESTRRARPASGSFGRTRVPGYHKAKTPRSFRSRHSYSGTGSLQSGHTRSSSLPVRPNTGTEDTDEAFLRMEAQLNSLIAEGKRALNSTIEVWDEE
ncbi:hypothetical protein BGZ76_008296 [Entomortierella beljakovae]|nr:hypothetical protein BGZ76_008296 [Entomortierella beljakovae]